MREMQMAGILEMTAILENEFISNIEKFDDKFGIKGEKGEFLFVKFANNAASLHPGWEPKFLFSGFYPILLLELRNLSGDKSTWYLDEKLNFLAADDLSQLDYKNDEILRQKFSKLFGDVWEVFSGGEFIVFDKKSRAFFLHNKKTRNALFERYKSESFPVSKIDLSNQENQSNILGSSGKQFPEIFPEDLISVLNSDLQAIIINFTKKNYMDWSEFTINKEIYKTSFSICFDDFRFSYRISQRNLVFYVIASLHHCQILGLYFPSINCIFYFGEEKLKQLLYCFGENFIEMLMSHVVNYGDMLEIYSVGKERQLSIFSRFTHLGHDLRNELTGLENFVRSVAKGNVQVPEVIAFRASLGSEIYGRTDEIFPELRGKIQRDIADIDSLIRHVYLKNRCIAHVTGLHVSSDLRERILRTNLDHRIPVLDRQKLSEIKNKRQIILVIGLRVENRTVVNLAEFCINIVKFIVSRVRGCTIVIDGHSALNPECGGAMFRSYQEELAETAPQIVEKNIANIVSKYYEDDENVCIIDNIGMPIRQSIFWCCHASFFVAISGSGLAKYRWVCNTPGLIITTKEGLKTNGEIRIYESPVMESSSPLRFLEPEFVEDMPNAPTLVPLPGDQPLEWNWNFNVKEEGVFTHLSAMLDNSGTP